MRPLLISLVVLIQCATTVRAQKAEPQISFAQEVKPHEYYVKQAELWAKELQKDSLSEQNWYNYFRSCRNAHGSADWRTDFVNESIYLMEGGDVVRKMAEYIPNTFTYYFTSYLTNGVTDQHYGNLLKAYQLDPDFPGIHASMISYAVCTSNDSLRREVNKKWYTQNYLSYQLLNYSYNMLMSLDSNAILLTQSDNDSYPTWMIQDVLGIRPDVKVINIDVMLLDDFRKTVFKELDLPQLDFEKVDLDEYRDNWKTIVTHCLTKYSGSRPIYVSMTLFDFLYQDFNDHLVTSGLVLRYSKESLDLSDFNRNLYESVFRLDYLDQPFVTDRNQTNVDYQNVNYISLLVRMYRVYSKENNQKEATRAKSLAQTLAKRIHNPDYMAMVDKAFE